jgi:Protein of unknown function (DUF3363)
VFVCTLSFAPENAGKRPVCEVCDWRHQQIVLSLQGEARRRARCTAPPAPPPRVRTLSTLDLEQQIGSDGATWLDRELVASARTPLRMSGFGWDVARALDHRAERLIGIGHVKMQPDGTFLLPRNLVAILERQEVERVGQAMAKERGLTFRPAKAGEYVSGTLAGSANLASGRYAMIDDGLGFSLVPWQPVLDQRIGQHITGVMRHGGIEWDFGRKLGLGL